MRAAGAAKYLKSELEFLGVPVPIVRRTAKAYFRARSDLDARGLIALASALWRTKVHELRSVAIAILELGQRRLDGTDAPRLIELVEDADTWAHVDWIAIKVAGPLLERTPSLGRLVDQWARHKNFWVRRTALLVFHDGLAAGAGDFEHFARLAAGMLDEREFFIRKAIGWVLRTTVKRRPALTIRFAEQHAAAMSGITWREATRNLPAGEVRRLERLRRAERGDA